MLINKKILVTLCLSSVIAVVALTSMKPEEEHKFKNLKVLPKHITDKQLDKVMDEWAHSLGVHCNFCHVRNEAEKKMDFASDTKPEKEMARHMYKMMNKINQKYFEAKKDSLGMVMTSGVNCNTCHKGTSHPEVTVPEGRKGPGGPPPGVPASGGAPAPQGDHKQ
jgi:hypothetical protein